MIDLCVGKLSRALPRRQGPEAHSEEWHRDGPFVCGGKPLSCNQNGSALTPRPFTRVDDLRSQPMGPTRTSSLGAARPLPPSADIGPGAQSVGQAAQFCLVVCWSSKDANGAVIARKFETDQSASGQLRDRLSAFLHKFCITECPAALRRRGFGSVNQCRWGSGRGVVVSRTGARICFARSTFVTTACSQAGGASAGSASPASACRAFGSGTSLLSPELIWKEYGDVVMTLAVSDHRPDQ